MMRDMTCSCAIAEATGFHKSMNNSLPLLLNSGISIGTNTRVVMFPLVSTLHFNYLKATQLNYIGHSQGATTAFAEFSRLPSTWLHKVKLFIALAPITYLHNQDSPLLKALVRVNMDTTLSELRDGEFIFTPENLMSALGTECQSNPLVCNNIPESLFGTSGMLNNTRADVFDAHWPDMTSRHNVAHWINFNGTLYDISKLRVPTAVFCGSSDDLAGAQDCNTLITTLSETKTLVAQQVGTFAHMDYLWAETAALSVYPKIVQLLCNH